MPHTHHQSTGVATSLPGERAEGGATTVLGSTLRGGVALPPRLPIGSVPHPLAAGIRVLVACEFSATVRDAFRARGFDAWSCDLLPTDGDPRWHLQGDALEAVYSADWDLVIAHPPCTYLSRAGARWWKCPERQKLADAAADFVFALRDAPVPHIAIENPIGQLNTRWRYPDQTIQPWEFGHPFSKATCLWLKRLPPLMPTDILASYKPLIRSNTGAGKRAGQKSHGGLSGGLITAKTFPGVAEAMAHQWGDYLLQSLAKPSHDTLSDQSEGFSSHPGSTGGTSGGSKAAGASFHGEMK